jgi:hypothetical protein
MAVDAHWASFAGLGMRHSHGLAAMVIVGNGYCDLR